MTIVRADIARYQSYLEFTQDRLRNCHPRDELHFQRLIAAYEIAIKALELLETVAA